MISRLRLPSAVTLALMLFAGCRGRHTRQEVKNEEPETGPSVVSVLKMSDQAAAAQLGRGFYGLESGSWRWTAGSFEVSLRPPIAAAQKGAILSFAFSIPEVVMQKVGPVTLTASIGSTKLAPAKYTAPGAYTYNAEVPAALLGTPTVNIGFVLDKFLAPGAVDQRELGLVATSVGLESK